MISYTYADATINSTLPLPELALCAARNDSATADFTFHLLDSSPGNPNTFDWIQHWGTTLSLAKRNNGYVMRFHNLADFIVTEDGRQVAAWMDKRTNTNTLRHLLLDQVMPRLLAHQGQLVLHASAVGVNDQIIAFAGESGRGKSTLAASLYVAGFPLLTDDGLLVLPGEDEVLAVPTYPGLRLNLEPIEAIFDQMPALLPMVHYSSKRRVLPHSPVTPSIMPLAALYLLGESNSNATDKEINVTRLSERDATMVLIEHSFQLDLSGGQLAANLLAQASTFASQLPVYSIFYPHNYSYLASVRTAVLNQHRLLAG